MRTLFFGSLFSLLILAGCGTAASADGGNADAAIDAAATDTADVAGDAVPDSVSDAASAELPLTDVPDAAQTDASTDAATTDATAVDVWWPDAPDAPDVISNGCCQTDSQCQIGGSKNICIPGKDCVPPAPTGKCWFDSDCKSGKCQNAAVCPCTADCSYSYSFGTCSDNLGSCCGGDKGGCTSSEICIDSAHICKPSGVTTGTCWTDTDCKVGTCQGATICPCGAMCAVADKKGTCVDNVKPGGCCNKNGGVCATGESCAGGSMCESKAVLSNTQCWNDSDCLGGGTCSGVNVCPCGAMCLVADKPGTCSTAPTTCTTVDPTSFGLCDMVIGVVFDGKSCVTASGCGCGKQCAQVFTDLATCQKACGI